MALAEAIRKAARGEAILHPRVTARITQALHAAQNTPPPQAPPPPFTDRTQAAVYAWQKGLMEERHQE